LASCSVREKDNSVVLARVNDQVLTVSKLEKLLPQKNRKDEQLKKFIRDWVDNALYYDAALKDGLHRDSQLSNERDRYYKKIVIGSYLQTKTSSGIIISNFDIRAYYDENPATFIRQNDEAYVYHFFTTKHSDARLIRSKLLKKQTAGLESELFESFDVEKKTVTKGFLLKKLDIAIFKNKNKSIVGPIRTSNGYHVFEILKIYKKGSRVGLEDVYDKIYQRLLKQKQVMLAADLLDSLKEKSNVFINSNYQ
jgi:parvulin-like peptidyl-prolyl isomerase